MSSRVIGIALLVVGVVLLVFGFNASDSPMDRVSEAFTGTFTDSTMLYLVLGAVGVVVGLVMTLGGRRV